MADFPQTMRGVVLLGHGGPEMLEHRADLAVPCPGRNEVLVRVAAAAVNNTDINTRVGWYSRTGSAAEDGGWTGQALQFPRIQGIDVCGTIAVVGADVDAARIGERVLIEPCLREAGGLLRDEPWFLGSECDGGFAEFVAVASRHAYAINSPFSSTELASFPCSYSTAENMLTRSGVTAKDTVLITGASGGVGSAAIQLARARGAAVAAVTSPSKAAALQSLGAGTIIGRDEDYVGRLGKNSVDVVIDLVGGPRWPKLLDVMRTGGRYAVSGAIGGPMVELDLRTLYLKDLSFFGCTVLEPAVFGDLVAHIEAGRIKPLVAETYGLRQIAEAQASFESKRHIGKIVLEVQED